ncbi:MAG TPA: serine/threonine-protein kinase [Byssovorax sp.]|jgi:serine/threonine-protein kinase
MLVGRRMANGGAARILGRYVLHEEFASGGMASVHFGRLVAEAGFTRTVAIKRLHPQHARDPAFVGMLLDEARVAARVRHPNVATILDVVAEAGEVFLVMEYVHGESLAHLLRSAALEKVAVPLAVGSAIVSGALRGLSAAHGATSETGEPLGIVHRDVSPENILVGVDGVPRVLDFGIALAHGRSQVTREGSLKGKLGYMAPELLEGAKATPLCDVYSTGVVLWETLVGRRLYIAEHEAAVLAQVLVGDVTRPSQLAPVPRALDDVVMCAVARQPGARFPSAEAFASALEHAMPPAATRDVAAFVASMASKSLEARAARIAAVETGRAAPWSAVMAAPVAAPAVAPAVLHTEVMAPAQLPDATGASAAPPRSASPSGFGSVTERRARTVDASRRRGTLVVIGLALLLTTLVVLLGVRALGHDDGAGASSATSASASSISSAAPVAPASAARAPVAPASAAPSSAPLEAPAASSSAAVAEPSSEAAEAPPRPDTPAPAHRAPRGASPRPPRAGKGADCDPPYTVDARGIHHYKPSCL